MSCSGGSKTSSAVSPLLGKAGPSTTEVSDTGPSLFSKAFVSMWRQPNPPSSLLCSPGPNGQTFCRTYMCQVARMLRHPMCYFHHFADAAGHLSHGCYSYSCGLKYKNCCVSLAMPPVNCGICQNHNGPYPCPYPFRPSPPPVL